MNIPGFWLVNPIWLAKSNFGWAESDFDWAESDFARYNNTGELVTITNDSTDGFKITANKDCYVYASYNYLFNSNIKLLNLPFPLAMSFFTFQTIAYLVDCYDGNIKKTSFTQYSLFIIFFPQLIAGPIVKYNHMMPQFNNEKNRLIDRQNLNLGLVLILIGLFKKIFLADNLAILVDSGFSNHQNLAHSRSSPFCL